MIVLKIGGSVFARDADAARIDVECLSRLAREIAPSVGSLVLVHGAGWHPRALLPESASDSRLPASEAPAAERLRRALGEIAAAVDRVLETAGLPVSRPGIRPGGVDASELGSLLARGRVPLLCGHIEDDSDGAFRIVSSDRIAVRAARLSDASSVVWATDVDGVLRSDREPGDVIEVLSAAEIDRIAEDRRESSPRTSTGEMLGKLAAASELARAGIPSVIVNGRAEGRVAAALAGSRVPGTRIEAVAG